MDIGQGLVEAGQRDVQLSESLPISLYKATGCVGTKLGELRSPMPLLLVPGGKVFWGRWAALLPL